MWMKILSEFSFGELLGVHDLTKQKYLLLKNLINTPKDLISFGFNYGIIFVFSSLRKIYSHENKKNNSR